MKTFQICQLLERNQIGFLRGTEKYVEALEKKILSHGFNVPYQRNLTRVEQRALDNLC